MKDGDRLLTEAPQAVQPTLPAKPIVPVAHSKFSNKVELSEEDFEKIKDMGIIADEFEFIDDGEFITSKEDFRRIELQFETNQDIADYILKNDVSGMSLKDLKTAIRKDLGVSITQSELKSTLESITKSGVAKVNVSDDTIQVEKPKQEQPKRQFEVMYKYQVRDGLGEPIIETTRPFCRRLIENSKLYTREEIQTMSSIFGYDIFSYGGGWYHNPETNSTTSFCRHQFKSKTVSRKAK